MFHSSKIHNNGSNSNSTELLNQNEIERSNFGFLYNGFTGFGSLDNLKDFDVLDSHIINHSYSLPNFRFNKETVITAPVAHLPNTKSAYNMRLQSPQAYKNNEPNSDFDNYFGDSFDSINDINSFQNISDSTFLQTCFQYSINPINLDFTPKIFWEKYKITHESAQNDKRDFFDCNNNNSNFTKSNNDNNNISFNNTEIIKDIYFEQSETRFDRIVTDFFRLTDEKNFNFFDKFNNSLKLIIYSKSFIPLVGLDYANDYIVKVNIKVFSRLIGIKDGINFLFNQHGALTQLGLNEITDLEIENFNEHINIEGIDFVNTKLIYHPDKLFSRSSYLQEN